MQEFFTSTLVSKFIKYLLMVTPLPICSYISDADPMIEGGTYLYHGRIYRCTRTGIFRGSYKEYLDKLYCSETVYPSDSLFVTDKLLRYGGAREAKYEITDMLTEGTPIYGLTTNFISTRSDYDQDTHMMLGEYLRFLNSQYGLNLMSLYNCFCEKWVEGIDLASGRLVEYNRNGYRTTIVPIKFNKTYTIMINNNTPIFTKAVLFNGKLIRNHENIDEFLLDDELHKVNKINHSSYRRPFTFKVSNSDGDIQKLERYLYMAIQIPNSVNTTITVLEGDYIDSSSINIFDDSMYEKSSDKFVDMSLRSGCSLLVPPSEILTTGKNRPFSDKLVEYLIGHTIDMRDNYTENVDRVTSSLNYRYGFEGSWSNQLRGKLYDTYLSLKGKKDHLNYLDILGYVDSDIEDALHNGIMSYNSNRKFNLIAKKIK